MSWNIRARRLKCPFPPLTGRTPPLPPGAFFVQTSPNSLLEDSVRVLHNFSRPRKRTGRVCDGVSGDGKEGGGK